MKRRLLPSTAAFAAIPYLLLSSSQQAGVITHLSPDGSGERVVFARCAAGRANEVGPHLARTLPQTDWRGSVKTVGQQSVTMWRSAQVANLATVPEAEVATLGIVQSPLSLFSTYVWKETLTFDRGEATDAEVSGQALTQLKYIVRMPGTITSTEPAGQAEGNKVEWDVKVGPRPQTFTVESRSLRWPYLLLWLWVLGFVASKAAVYAPRAARKIRRKPRRI